MPAAYKNYIKEIKERKKLSLHAKPIEDYNLINEIISQIKSKEHPERKRSIDFLIYNVVPGTTNARIPFP